MSAASERDRRLIRRGQREGLRRAAEIVRSDEATTRAEKLVAELSSRAGELPPDLASLLSTFCYAWADDAADLAAAIEAEAAKL